MSYSILTTDFKNNSDLIDRIYSFFKQHFPLEDFTIFTDEITYASSRYSMLTSFYLVAYKGSVIFLDLEEYIEYRDTVSGDKIVFIPKDKLHLIDRSILKQCSVVVEIDNNLKWINNYELQ